MKKLLCMLFILVLMFNITACNQEDDGKVTIYIPTQEKVYGTEGKLVDSTNIVFEDGWEEKEHFIEQRIGTGLNPLTITITHGDRFQSTQSDIFGTSSETYYNEEGLIERTVTTYTLPEYAEISKSEIVYTYDGQKRILTQNTKKILLDGTVQETNLTYVYQQTADGSKGTATEDGVVAGELTYDKNNRRISMVSYENGVEAIRIQWSYDNHEKSISSVTIVDGKQIAGSETTYEAVRVSPETARRLPQFQCGGI